MRLHIDANARQNCAIFAFAQGEISMASRLHSASCRASKQNASVRKKTHIDRQTHCLPAWLWRGYLLIFIIIINIERAIYDCNGRSGELQAFRRELIKRLASFQERSRAQLAEGM